MKRAYFITGTDTGVGKTFVAASMATALRAVGVDVGVMKPVESGCADEDGALVPHDAVRLKEAAMSADPIGLICPFMLSNALSPHLAARLEGVEIDFRAIKAAYARLSGAHEAMIVEGAGGLLTPLTGARTNRELIAELGLPVIIVAASRLGAINHTLLTVECARSAGLEVACIMLNHPTIELDRSSKSNRAEIERLAKAPVMHEFPHEKEESPPGTGEGLFQSIEKLFS